MKTLLTPSFFLSDEHAASSYSQPVLVDRHTGAAFGPGDILRPYPSWSLEPASRHVRRMARTAGLDDDGQRAVESFCGG